MANYLSCRKIASFIMDEYKANKEYEKLSNMAKKDNKKLASAKFDAMSMDEGKHNNFLLGDIADAYGCLNKKWFQKKVKKIQVRQ